MGRIWTSCTGERILARLGPELTGDLYVESSQRDIVPGHDLDEVEPRPWLRTRRRERPKIRWR